MQLHKILTVVNIYGKDYTLVMRSFMHGQMCGLRVLSHSADSVLIQHRMDYVDWPILIPDMCGRVVDQHFRGEPTGPHARGVVDQRLGRPALSMETLQQGLSSCSKLSSMAAPQPQGHSIEANQGSRNIS